MLLWVFLILAENFGFRVFFFRSLFFRVIPAGLRAPAKGGPGRFRAGVIQSRRPLGGVGCGPWVGGRRLLCDNLAQFAGRFQYVTLFPAADALKLPILA